MADNDYWQIEKVAAAHGMTVAAWEERCLAIEAAEKNRRRIDRQMRQVPQYRSAAA